MVAAFSAIRHHAASAARSSALSALVGGLVVAAALTVLVVVAAAATLMLSQPGSLSSLIAIIRVVSASLCLLAGATVSLGLPVLTPAAAAAQGVGSLVIGVAPIGGQIAADWIPTLFAAVEAGLDVVAGLHTSLSSVPGLADAAQARGVRLVDVRRPPAGIPIATGRKRSGRRLATVGTDCALGKKYTALSLTNAFQARGIDADFRATGQTGIMIAGGGIPMDAVVSDFLSGAAEILSPDAAPDHWDVIEGQGSLYHPGFAGVTRCGGTHHSPPAPRARPCRVRRAGASRTARGHGRGPC